MIDLEKTALHRVYKTELFGDALVITLQGDAPGFSIGSVHNEMSTIIGLAKSPEVRNLIVDISGSNYYGSLILGEIVSLGQMVREKGGRVALAGTSPDTKEILRMMRLDALWERYPTRSMALRALANLSWQDRLRPYAKQAAIAGGVLLLVLLYFVIPRKDYTRQYYEETVSLWSEAQRLKSKSFNDTDWLLFNRRSQKKLDELTRHLKKIASARNPAAQNLLWVVRDHAPKAIEKQLDPANEDTIFTSYHLATAKALLEKTKLPPRPKELEKLLDSDSMTPPAEATPAAAAP
jgi:anti-anti-sigma factor